MEISSVRPSVAHSNISGSDVPPRATRRTYSEFQKYHLPQSRNSEQSLQNPGDNIVSKKLPEQPLDELQEHKHILDWEKDDMLKFTPIALSQISDRL